MSQYAFRPNQNWTSVCIPVKKTRIRICNSCKTKVKKLYTDQKICKHCLKERR